MLHVWGSKSGAAGSSMCKGGALCRRPCVQPVVDDVILHLLLGLVGDPSGFQSLVWSVFASLFWSRGTCARQSESVEMSLLRCP